MPTHTTRRQFIHGSALAGAGLMLTDQAAFARRLSASEKVNIGVIGVAGRGGDNLNGVSGQNIVALCDVDDNNLTEAAKRFPGAKTYNDFRRLLEQKDLEAVAVSTPDH